MATDPTSASKEARLNIRTTAAEKRLFERAARVARMTTSQFVVQAAAKSAEELLAEQTRFVLPSETWDEFVAALDRPAREIPELRRAFEKRSPFSERS